MTPTATTRAIPASRQRRILVAGLCGVAFWALNVLRLRAAGPYALGYDFTFHWWAIDALRRGYSPYLVINGWSLLYPFSGGYFYWLPAALLLYPFGYLPLQVAMPIFSGLSVAVLAYALTRDGWWRLPFLASLPLYTAAVSGQVVPLLVAAMLLPALGWLAPMKFTLGAAGAVYQPSRKYLALAAAVTLVSIAAFPWWPRQWWAERHDVVGGPYYHIPIMVLAAGGPVLLVALLRWRRPEARLLAAMACIPQTMYFYDQLPLLLVARDRRQALLMSILSWLPPGIMVLLHGTATPPRWTLFAWYAPIIVCVYYLPCLAVVLARPNRIEAAAAPAKLPVPEAPEQAAATNP